MKFVEEWCNWGYRYELTVVLDDGRKSQIVADVLEPDTRPDCFDAMRRQLLNWANAS